VMFTTWPALFSTLLVILSDISIAVFFMVKFEEYAPGYVNAKAQTLNSST